MTAKLPQWLTPARLRELALPVLALLLVIAAIWLSVDTSSRRDAERAGSDAEEQRITNLTSSTGDSDIDGSDQENPQTLESRSDVRRLAEPNHVDVGRGTHKAKTRSALPSTARVATSNHLLRTASIPEYGSGMNARRSVARSTVPARLTAPIRK